MSGHARCACRVEADVESQRDLFGPEVFEPGSDLFRLDESGAADDDSGDAEVEHLRDRGGIAQSSAHLELDGILGGEVGDDGAVCAAAVARAVEVDDVQPIGAEIAVLGEQHKWRGVVAGFRLRNRRATT